MKNFFIFAMLLRVVLYSVNDYTLLQNAQTQLENVTQAAVSVSRSNEDLVELQGSWNGQAEVVEAAKKALGERFRLDASYETDDAMTLLFRKRDAF